MRHATAIVARATVVGLVLLTAACHDLLTPTLPAGTSDPSSVKTEAGALALRRGVIARSADALTLFVAASGLLTDELEAGTRGRSGGSIDPSMYADERILPEPPVSTLSSTLDEPYGDLQVVRGEALGAIGALRTYAPAQPPALTAEMYALQGYAEVMLADLYCSGVPLSTLDFEGDFTYRAGSSTPEVYQHAVVLFDTALVLAAADSQILNLARVGRGRALLALSHYAEAAAAVAAVPDGYRYQLSMSWRGGATGGPMVTTTVSDREGTNGLAFISSGDPRTASHQTGINEFGLPQYFADKYGDPTAQLPITLASGVEARLIESEAALQAGDPSTWLATLNHLRATAIAPALPDTTDPGTPDGRVALLFRERAFWLFLTGHRQGDLRRVIRQYHRPQNAVYPTGVFDGGRGLYGADVTAAIPAQEHVNPLFTGCLDREP